jgi:hypothetical protein
MPDSEFWRMTFNRFNILMENYNKLHGADETSDNDILGKLMTGD